MGVFEKSTIMLQLFIFIFVGIQIPGFWEKTRSLRDGRGAMEKGIRIPPESTGLPGEQTTSFFLFSFFFFPYFQIFFFLFFLIVWKQWELTTHTWFIKYRGYFYLFNVQTCPNQLVEDTYLYKFKMLGKNVAKFNSYNAEQTNLMVF